MHEDRARLRLETFYNDILDVRYLLAGAKEPGPPHQRHLPYVSNQAQPRIEVSSDLLPLDFTGSISHRPTMYLLSVFTLAAAEGGEEEGLFDNSLA